jgi:hypothetical protein
MASTQPLLHGNTTGEQESDEYKLEEGENIEKELTAEDEAEEDNEKRPGGIEAITNFQGCGRFGQCFDMLQINPIGLLKGAMTQGSGVEKPAGIWKTAPADAKARFSWGSPLLIAVTVIAMCCISPFFPVWFWYHPAAMLLAYVGFMGNAVLIRKLMGKQATLYHGWIMGLAASVAVLGWYVIYSNKNAEGKAHITTWHGLFGVITLVVTIMMSVCSYSLLDPYMGKLKQNFTVRCLLILSFGSILPVGTSP